MCGRTVGIFKQAIFRSPLMDSDKRTAREEVARAERTKALLSSCNYLNENKILGAAVK